MGLLKQGCFIALAAIGINLVPTFLKSRLPTTFGGTVDKKFQKVEDVFKSNFEHGKEREGASFAVYHKGKLVVDLWGGYADESAGRTWKKDTISIVYSSTKGMASICAAMLVDRGFLDYDTLVTKYWPNFGKHGKDNATVGMLLSHQAGLAAIDAEITKNDVLTDWEGMAKRFEDQVPNWPPGTAAGYHALTFGFLVDQIVRRSDPKKRSLGTFFRQEIGEPYGVDFHIGLPMSEAWRAARFTEPTLMDTLPKLLDMNTLAMWSSLFRAGDDSLFKRSIKNPKFCADRADRAYLNDPEMQGLEMAAFNGVGNARALAKTYSLLSEGRLVKKKKILDKIREPLYVQAVEKVFGLKVDWGWGFFHAKNPQGGYQFGHPGYGGQNGKVDLDNDLAFAYVTNGLTPDMGDSNVNFAKLQKALYESL